MGHLSSARSELHALSWCYLDHGGAYDGKEEIIMGDKQIAKIVLSPNFQDVSQF